MKMEITMGKVGGTHVEYSSTLPGIPGSVSVVLEFTGDELLCVDPEFCVAAYDPGQARELARLLTAAADHAEIETAAARRLPPVGEFPLPRDRTEASDIIAGYYRARRGSG